MPRVLVVEDDPAMGAGVVRHLRKAGFEVVLAVDGVHGLALAFDDPGIDLVVLDLMLPGHDGYEVLRRLRQHPPVPVVVITARVALSDRLQAFELGAIDFLPKPFFIEELLVRIQTRLGRAHAPQAILRYGSLTYLPEARRVEVDGQQVLLTPAETTVLAYLVDRPGRAVSRAHLADALSGYPTSPRTTDTHVARLRKKLGPAGDMIVTVWGHGYRFDPDRVP